MSSTDPMLPIWALALAIITALIGFAFGRITARRRRRPSYHWSRP